MKFLTAMTPLRRNTDTCPECGDPAKETVLRFGAWVLCADCAHETFIFLGDPCTRQNPCGFCRLLEQEQSDARAASVVASPRTPEVEEEHEPREARTP